AEGVYLIIPIQEEDADEPTRERFCTKTQGADCRISTPEQLFVFARATAARDEDNGGGGGGVGGRRREGWGARQICGVRAPGGGRGPDGRQRMTVGRALVALALMSLPAAAADELPNEMNFQCEGKMNAVLDAAKPESRNSTFRINLRLRDRVIVDTQTGLVEG